MDGIEMVRTVKSQPQNANVSILMLTTDGQPALIKKAKEAGAKGWIVKPFKPAQLVAVVQKLAGVA
jgi:two-component system chemotaxis response regulator CheY